ncbi:hypothetical protein B0H10DRAFT_1998098 [Mycena sp. CBHHK59/15]|nr:hypothetical protein B0H10DRAFT_1998098 [Mycena sp. CBHHK59/15]
MATAKSFSGPARKLVLGIDVGTTFSGMSFSILEPGRVPSILPVTRFPAQEHVGGDSKVPSVLYYDRFGVAKALGAEALQESVDEKAEDEGWEKSSWFKLHLRPGVEATARTLHPLPANKKAVDVYADFLRYLFRCARVYIEEAYPAGNALWIALQDGIEFILTHPNGWEGEQQSEMRKAAIVAGLIPNNADGHKRVHFVTEGEASLHFCIRNGLASDPLRLGKGVIIVDAGGGTIDISTYRKVVTTKGESFEEIAPPKCVFQGSIFVSQRAGDHLREKLRGSKYADDVEHIRECFDKTTKLRFRATDEWSHIKFGRPRDKDLALNINCGQLKLPGADVAGFFRPSLDAMVHAIARQQAVAHAPVSSVLLVGGFAASDWLYSELKVAVKSLGLELSRPDSYVNKAVADGAVSYYLDHYVSARISKHTHGIECVTAYIPDNAEHQARSTKVIDAASGEIRIPNVFSAILAKNTRVLEITEFRQSYTRDATDRSMLTATAIPILRYLGKDEDPRWTDINPGESFHKRTGVNLRSQPGKYSVVCTVHADTSQIANTLKPCVGLRRIYYRLNIDVVLSFGLTELKAQISWVENGVEKRGLAELMY